MYLVSDASEWHGGVDEGDRYLQLNLNGPEWEALFFDVLHCPEPEPYGEGMDIREYDNHFRIRFQHSIPEFPMLGRLWDTYRDVGYAPEQVKKLLEECVRIQAKTQNMSALEGLRKLILACNEALQAGSGLFLVSD